MLKEFVGEELFFKAVPKCLRTRELCLVACARNANNVAHVPLDMLDDHMFCLRIVKNNPFCAGQLPARTRGICDLAVFEFLRQSTIEETRDLLLALFAFIELNCPEYKDDLKFNINAIEYLRGRLTE